jgi:hypothetical protein
VVNDPRPRDHTDASKDIAHELADDAATLAFLKDEAYNRLHDPNLYSASLHGLEGVHAAEEVTVEAPCARCRWPGPDSSRQTGNHSLMFNATVSTPTITPNKE